VREPAPEASAIALAMKVTQETGHALEPEERWPAEGRGVAERPLYTFPTGSVEVISDLRRRTGNRLPSALGIVLWWSMGMSPHATRKATRRESAEPRSSSVFSPESGWSWSA
jgi:hypothetical protein